eukprot:TRINITY_DN2202_c1_g1_i14.p3 TRINITY_DN2202_c1_g1~~TRINITY_DN2202_c1_g1_i14.p3  ORF type:complete len:248 (-),score=25.00 TRINITY_DN2202_c1_g1_i14:124-867(-)
MRKRRILLFQEIPLKNGLTQRKLFLELMIIIIFACLAQIHGRDDLPSLPPFYAKEQVLSLFVGALMGLQHCLAMVGGIITPPLLVSFAANDPDTQLYLVSAALIVSGICTILQVSRFRIPIPGFPIYIGSGILSVMGTSFTFLPITQSAIATMQSEDGSDFDEAYGKVLGTFALCALVEIFLALVPPPILKVVFPPVVSGATVILIGTALTGTGLRYWGGGVFCSSNPVNCNGNGEVFLPYGSHDMH